MASDEGAGERQEDDLTEEDILRELEDQIKTSTVAAETPVVSGKLGGEVTAPGADGGGGGGGGTGGGWFSQIPSFSTIISTEEKEAISKGTEEIQKELGKVGTEFNQSIQQIGGLVGGALGISGGPAGFSSGGSKQDRFNSLFPDLKEQKVVEMYECQLVEKFRCYHNAFLPEKAFKFGGTLFLTVGTVAFSAHSDYSGFGKSEFPVSLKMEDVDKVQRLDDSGMIKVTTKKQVSVFFSDFAAEPGFYSAHALIDNLSKGEGAPPSEPPVTSSSS
uniref:GRAM domain-containing protein n=1 Tax=Rhodosorus marinus TaxID=101924 RepID=A0A7S0BQ41_9RHOD|mmetsp:Transcript_3724/g.5289  ORF Transcript_3724/g.5289 Transcript_3724/m.5289 type:complete len:275 (+) Transcript_3724:83-907(+)